MATKKPVKKIAGKTLKKAAEPIVEPTLDDTTNDPFEDASDDLSAFSEPFEGDGSGTVLPTFDGDQDSDLPAVEELKADPKVRFLKHAFTVPGSGFDDDFHGDSMDKARQLSEAAGYRVRHVHRSGWGKDESGNTTAVYEVNVRAL